MTFIPEHIVTDNPHGILSFGPIAPEDKDDNTAMLLSLDGGHTILCNKNGNKAEINPGKSEELCGTELVKGDQQEASEEAIAKIITARNGDICIIAENGNIKLKAKNIYAECTGADNDGSFLLKANDHISMIAGEQMTMGGSKICMVSSDAITLNAQGVINQICADVVKSSPVNVVSKILKGDVLGAFIDTVRKTCG
jgi:hypothetical protein